MTFPALNESSASRSAFEIANALRCASKGGSSKQFLMLVRGGETRMRAINPREAARLMRVCRIPTFCRTIRFKLWIYAATASAFRSCGTSSPT